ncbi:PPE family protein [Mycobacterium mantenii]|uniref:PPE family protein n=1 Tax=Mycobacterium mantenii TaxID=560555 RepID=A0A1X0G527_MYCNT|nr:PPE family protein [Mycobacterium mantenii]MCV7243674.1 PPE family protein [Mycobacterium mantenii]ORB08859.1 PPE family protein [Mycobacterium mantenii]BBY41511.1 PPE family protein [Mycobacterium mantenii]
MDFGFLPPEVNSGRMYAGPGSGSLLAAAGSWDSLSAELGITAAVYESVLSGLTGLHWQGAASQAMAASAAPYAAWLYTTAERAQQTAMQARAAAAAYELAHAMTVPPPVVAANRTQLAMLVATNFFGQNTAAIAATEAQYAEYWAQDAAAMYSYSAGSAAAVQFSPFSSPRQTTNANGVLAQQAAVAQAHASSAGSNSGSQVASSAAGSSSQLFRIFDTIQGASTAFRAIFTTEGIPSGIIQADKNLGILPNLAAVPAAFPKAPALSVATSGLGNVNAVLARAGRIGPMSVPAGWASATGNSVSALPGGGLSDLAVTEAVGRTGSGTPGIPGIPGGTVRRATLVVPRYGRRIMVMARPPAAG